MPDSIIAMNIPALLSIQEAKASPVAADSTAKPSAIFATVGTGLCASCFMPQI